MAIFKRVVDAGSFVGTARHFGISPEMAGNHVRVLEAHLGVRLLNRTTRRMHLTEAGAAYHARCLQILSEIEEAEAEAASLTGETMIAYRGYRVAESTSKNVPRSIARVVIQKRHSRRIAAPRPAQLRRAFGRQCAHAILHQRRPPMQVGGQIVSWREVITFMMSIGSTSAVTRQLLGREAVGMWIRTVARATN
jgi:hypothetical protein